ncbi:glutaredoxin family protein [Helcococcus massiliensis]|uniref:glutaredoxin family protein n=1 Tax=Helcococcus massiliensis TaxID=2040290 RepID=UPI000CDE8DD2|nr:glutaredoxin family protein [Helcococcus massiliensis]
MKKVTVYTSNTCPYCVAAKDFLTENNVEFEEKNVTESLDYREELLAKGYRGVPVLVIGDEEIVGFDQNRISELLGL